METTPVASVDIAVIGGGIVGSAIARELAGTSLSVALIEARADVGDGTSKANTAILHTGFDAMPGTLESQLVARGFELLGNYAERTGIPIERTGAVLVAWNQEELDALPGLKEKAERNGYLLCEIIDACAVYARVPALADGVGGGLTVPDESIICTWTTNLALATDAVHRGTELLRDCRVTGVEAPDGERDRVTILQTTRGPVHARWVINAAGLGADYVDQMFGYNRFTVTPRRGELFVFDKLARAKVPHIVLPVPTSRGKGVLVSPTIYGNVMLGPTSEDLQDRTATGTSEEGAQFLLAKGRQLMPTLLDEEVTATYAGLRAAIDGSDYLIELDEQQRYLLVGGIRSTGLTAGMAIAEHVMGILDVTDLDLTRRSDLPAPPHMPNIGEAGTRPYQNADLIAEDSEYGRMVCFCERVTAGEIRDAIGAAIPPADLGGLRRRTRIMTGRCQGFYCGAHTRTLLESGIAEVRQSACPIPGSAQTKWNAEPRADRSAAGNLAIEKVPVAIVGGGPSGLTAAAALAATVNGAVLVIERERETGGIPRHCDHLGYGIRDLRRFISGPAYARRLTAAALDAGARLETEAQVTGWDGEHRLVITSPRGRRIVEADAIVLATGARERPRPARLIAGDRPGGVYTTGELQNLVHVHRANVGRRAVVIGGELVSWSAVLTLREAGCTTAAMVTRYDRAESYAAFRVTGRLALRTPIVAHSRVVRINGKTRVESVVIEDLRTQKQHTIECDTVITTGDWIPDHELARLAAIDIDHGTRGPVVDGGFRTSAPGVFAIGNLVHPVDTADVAALDGQHVAASVVGYIGGGTPQPRTVPITASPPFRWVSPQRIAPGTQTSRGDLLLWSEEFHRFPVVRARQDGKVIGEHRTLWPASPGRVFRSPSEIVANANPLGGPIAIDLVAPV